VPTLDLLHHRFQDRSLLPPGWMSVSRLIIIESPPPTHKATRVNAATAWGLGLALCLTASLTASSLPRTQLPTCAKSLDRARQPVLSSHK